MRQTKTVERSRVRAPPGAVLGSRTLNNGTQVGIPDTIPQLATVSATAVTGVKIG